MNNNDIVLMLLTAIELVNLVVRVIKMISLRKQLATESMPQHDPPIDKNILKTMYC